MVSQNNKLSHGRKYFKCAQGSAIGLVVAIFFASFITAACGVSGQLNFITLHGIWFILLPLIILLFDVAGRLWAKYANIPNYNKKILYGGDYDNLVSKLFDSGFLLQSKIGSFYQFTSYASLVCSYALLVKKEGAQYSIFGEEAIIEAIFKDLAPEALEIEVINTHANVKKDKRHNNFKGFFVLEEAANDQKNITTEPEEEENRRS